jgi:hypothetical protein
MSFRRAVEMTGTSILLFATAALIATTGCSSGGGSSGTGGAPGTGGHGTGGHVATGGATGTGGSGMGGGAVMPTCIPITADGNHPVIMDFSDPSIITFGDNATTVTGTLLQFNGMMPDQTGGTWNFDGQVTGYGEAGIGIDFQTCPEVDMSAFTGLAFDIAGVITPQTDGVDAGTLPAQAVFFQVSTAEDDVASNFDAQGSFAPSFGLCTPVSNQYDGTCTTPSVTVALTPGPTLVTKSYTWSQITGGKGMPSGRATPNPAKITHIRWIFPYNGVVPFHMKLTLDNFRGLTAGGTPDSGTPPPPADAATGG